MTSERRRQHEHDVAHPHETRAGPGDAGASDRPTRLPESPGSRRKGRRAVLLFVVLCVAALLVIGLFNRAGMP